MQGPWLDPSDQCVWRRFMAMQGALLGRLFGELQRQTGLSGADYEVLVHLSESHDRTMRVFELAEATGWEKSRLSHHLTRMEGRGLVQRAGCPTDSRGTVVGLTEAGWETIVSAAPVHAGHVQHWFIDPLTPAQRAALGDIADAITASLVEEAATADGCGEPAGTCGQVADEPEDPGVIPGTCGQSAGDHRVPPGG